MFNFKSNEANDILVYNMHKSYNGNLYTHRETNRTFQL